MFSLNTSLSSLYYVQNHLSSHSKFFIAMIFTKFCTHLLFIRWTRPSLLLLPEHNNNNSSPLELFSILCITLLLKPGLLHPTVNAIINQTELNSNNTNICWQRGKIEGENISSTLFFLYERGTKDVAKVLICQLHTVRRCQTQDLASCNPNTSRIDNLLISSYEFW